MRIVGDFYGIIYNDRSVKKTVIVPASGLAFAKVCFTCDLLRKLDLTRAMQHRKTGVDLVQMLYIRTHDKFAAEFHLKRGREVTSAPGSLPSEAFPLYRLVDASRRSS